DQPPLVGGFDQRQLLGRGCRQIAQIGPAPEMPEHGLNPHPLGVRIQQRMASVDGWSHVRALVWDATVPTTLGLGAKLAAEYPHPTAADCTGSNAPSGLWFKRHARGPTIFVAAHVQSPRAHRLPRRT